MVSLLAMVAAVFAILAVVRLRGEETSGRAEPVLATALDRYRWLTGHLTVALVGGTAVLLASGLGIGLTASASTGDWSLLPGLLGAAAGYVPTVWLATGLALALFGWAPRALHLAWLVLGYGILIGMLGGLLQLPDWTFDLSPFTHVPQLPAAAMAWTPVLVLAAIAAALVAAGFAGFRRRGLETV